jgi:hypothetical protein
MQSDWDRKAEHAQGIKAKSSHEGVVLAMGAPARTAKDAEIDPGFAVGDRVRFVWKHNEEAFTQTWTDGEPCCWIAQSEVIGVYE